MKKNIVFIFYTVMCAGFVASSEERKCGPNQTYDCVFDCPPQKTCENRNTEFYCTESIEPCHYRCVCKVGYIENAVGECILAKDCDKCTGKHEFYSTCGGACDTKCSSRDIRNRTHCDIATFACVAGCYCEDGYARDDFDNCVPVEQCNEGCSGPHQYNMKCKQTCPPDECASIVSRYDCTTTPPCSSGCVCQEGFLRLKKDSPCIPNKECPQWPKN